MKGFLLSLTVLILTSLAFLRSGECTLVNLDDYDYLPKAREVKMMGVTDLSQAIWMPLTWLSYKVDLIVAGDSNSTTTADSKTIKFMHLHSVALHAANAVLLFWLISVLFGGSGWMPAVAALIWAVHPLRVESVTWIASRKDVLSMFWLLCAILTWVSWRKSGGWIRYGLSAFLFLVGSAAKPSVMCFPGIVFIIDMLLLKVWRTRDIVSGGWRVSLRHLLAYVPVGILAIGIAWFAGFAQHAGGAMDSTAGVPLWWKLFNAATAVGMYIKNTFWPVDLCCQSYMRYPSFPRGWWFGVPVCIALLWWLKCVLMRLWNGVKTERESLRRWEPVMLCGVLWFLGAIFPMLGIIGFGGHAFADRFTYIPAVGFSVAFAGLASMTENCRHKRRILAGMGLTAILACSALTVRQIGFWRDDSTLWAHTLAVDGETNFMAHTVLGTYHFEFTHNLDKCISHYERALELNTDWSGRTGVMYLIALAETGRRGRLQDAYIKYNKWFRDHFGTNDSVNQGIAEAAYQLGREDPSLPPGDGFKRASEIIAASSDYAKMIPETGYLKYLLAKRSSDKATASKCAEELVADRKTTFGDAYLRFRFLERIVNQDNTGK